MGEGALSEYLYEMEYTPAYGIQLQVSLWIEYDKVFQNQQCFLSDGFLNKGRTVYNFHSNIKAKDVRQAGCSQ